jgi:hypothetical protein
VSLDYSNVRDSVRISALLSQSRIKRLTKTLDIAGRKRIAGEFRESASTCRHGWRSEAPSKE